MIKGNPTKNDTKTINDIVMDLDTLLETIHVKIVNNKPSLIIYFDTLNDGKFYPTSYSITNGMMLENFTFNNNGDKKQHNNIFFSEITQGEIHISQNRENNYRNCELWYKIINYLGEFNKVFSKNEEESVTTANREKPGMSATDRFVLKKLYSKNGEKEIKTILGSYTDTNSNTNSFLIVLVAFMLLFVLSEINHYYGFFDTITGKKTVLKRFFESIFLAQIPILAYILFYFFKDYGVFVSEKLKLLPEYEFYFCIYAVILGQLFLLLDTLLKFLKTVWLNLSLNFIFTFILVAFTYQIIFFFISPEWIKPQMIEWSYVLIALLITLYRFYLNYEKNKISGLLQEKELELVKQKELTLKSDLNALQARINPHFLYNSLNSIASLAHIDAYKTEKMALSLSKLFRYNINKEDEHFTTLSDELEMVKTYLDIEKIRFDEKLNFTIEINEELKDFRIPKFLLQPVVENAVKHGISKVKENGIIEIKVFEENKKIIILVYDNGPEFPLNPMLGYGLQNTYEKLKLMYNKPFDIEFINTGRKNIRISLNK